jgi:hypothetical protein
MRHVATLLAAAALATLAGCTTMSDGPTYTVYPGRFLWFGGPNPPGPWETYGPRYRAAELPPTSYQLLKDAPPRWDPPVWPFSNWEGPARDASMNDNNAACASPCDSAPAPGLVAADAGGGHRERRAP